MTRKEQFVSSRLVLPVIPALDGVRGMAALMVMGYHFFLINSSVLPEGTIYQSLSRFAAHGATGVDLFFVLSGFLITRILLATRERHDYLPSFYIRRSLRIFPLYYLYLGIHYCLMPYLNNGPIVSFAKQWPYWCYLQNIPVAHSGLAAEGPGHFWSLAVEEHFYLLWPLVVLVVPPRSLGVACGGVIALALATRLAFELTWSSISYTVYFFTPCRIDALGIGALLATWEYNGALPVYRRHFLGAAFTLSASLAIFLVLFGGKGVFGVYALRFTLIASFYGCVIGLISIGTGTIAARVLSSSLLRRTGQISYGLYVYHPLVYAQFVPYTRHSGLSLATTLAASVVGTYVVAWLSYRLFEAQFLRLKDRYTYRTVRRTGTGPDNAIQAEPRCI